MESRFEEVNHHLRSGQGVLRRLSAGGDAAESAALGVESVAHFLAAIALTIAPSAADEQKKAKKSKKGKKEKKEKKEKKKGKKEKKEKKEKKPTQERLPEED